MRSNFKGKDPSSVLHIVPLVPISKGKSSIFSYISRENSESMPRGSLVSISFGPRILRGIVWQEHAHDTPSTRKFLFKPVQRLLKASLLSEQELAFAEFLSQTSNISLGTALERFVPKTIETIQKSELPISSTHSYSLAKKYRLSVDQKKAVCSLGSLPKSSSALLFGPSPSGKTLVIFEVIRKSIERGGQALILFPDQSILLQEEIRYGNIFGPQSIIVFHAGLKDREKEAIRSRIRCGTSSIILGTGSSLFLPFRDLRLIVEDDSDIPSREFHEIESSFSVSTNVLAKKLTELHEARLIQVSSTPSFVSFFRAKRDQSLVELPAFKQNVVWNIVNLRLERWKKKTAPISEDLKYLITAMLVNKKQGILFVRRSGMNAFSMCVDCKAVFRCSSCEKIIANAKGGEYICYSCKKNFGATPSCSFCGSLSFKHIGMGTEQVERDLKRKFPHIRCVRYDKNTQKQKRTFSALREFIEGNREVLITTERGIRGWDLPSISLVAMIDADSMLNISDWDSDERALRIFLSVAGRTGRSESDSGTVILQTFHPENPLFEFLKQKDISGFFSSIEEDRRLFLHPPFGNSTRIVCRASNEKKLTKEITRVYSLLESEQKKHKEKTYISVSKFVRTVQGKFLEKSIVIRESLPSDTKRINSLFSEIIDSLPLSMWIIK